MSFAFESRQIRLASAVYVVVVVVDMLVWKDVLLGVTLQRALVALDYAVGDTSLASAMHDEATPDEHVGHDAVA